MQIMRFLIVIACGFSITCSPLYAATASTSAITASGVLAFTNVERHKAGVPLLANNSVLSSVALRKMQDLFARQYFAHMSPTGEDVSSLAHDAGYAYIAVGENLALGGFSSSKDVVTAWMNSPGHRANILAKKFSEIGIAAGKGMYDGHEAWIVVQTFGLPRASCPALNMKLKATIDSEARILDALETIARAREKATFEKGVSRTEYKERVVSYNAVARVYNERAAVYKKTVEEYNKGVDRLNACINAVTKEKESVDVSTTTPPVRQ